MTQIKQINEPNSEKEIHSILHPIVSKWFKKKFGTFSDSQKYSIIPIYQRKNLLLSSPTGSGKTLSAFASILSYLIGLAEKGKLEDRVYAVYTSPLKALARDIEVNLNQPLKEMIEIAEQDGTKLQKIRVGLRTGDTTVSERAKMARKPPHIFVTTPESLAIILTSKKFVENMRNVEFCIVDEIHAMENKRGTYLSLTLERLNEVSKTFPTKIGLSATVEPMEEVARYLVGESEDRTVGFIRVPLDKKIDIDVLRPVEDLIEDKNISHNMYQLLSKLIREHKTTLIFTNTRSATERVVNHLKEKFPTEYGDDNIAAHHSSLSREHRFDIEERLRKGNLKVVVCSTSLELGIDIGYIDLVVMIGSPKSSSRALQRMGRAGHKLHEVAKGRFIVLDRDDLIECSVIQKEMIEKKINLITFPKNCLDVLSQQIFGMAIYKIWNIDELLSLIKKSYCYANLSRKDFLDVVSYLSGEYDLEKNSVYKKIWYDSESKQIGKRGKLARVLYLTNIGTIPDESFVNVKLSSGENIGAIDEGFLERMKKGDVFVLGGKKYLYRYTRGMNVYVNSAERLSPTIPSWFSEMLPLSFDSGLEINTFRRMMNEKFQSKKPKSQIKAFIKNHLYLSNNTEDSIYDYFYEQHKFLEIPHEGLMLLEKCRLEEKDYLIFHSMYGRRVNDALSRAFGFLLGKMGSRDVEIGINDNGFYLAGEAVSEESFHRALKYLVNDKSLKEVLESAIEKTDVLARRFRHCAARSLMILKNYRGRSKSVGKQQMKSHFLLHAVKKLSNEFPILREARREVLEDLMDIKNAKKVINWIAEGKIKIKFKITKIPSPFATNLIIQGYSDLIKIEDRQEFLKRMHQEHLKIIGEGER